VKGPYDASSRTLKQVRIELLDHKPDTRKPPSPGAPSDLFTQLDQATNGMMLVENFR
jgi:hypothetical protein